MHTLPTLSYSYTALEPVIDAKTVEIHYTKHHAAYVDNLNKALQAYPELAALSVKDLLTSFSTLPEAIKTAVRNHGGGHSNHTLYWDIMTPGGSSEPVGELAAALKETFGSKEEFFLRFEAAGMARFGSGWVWLVKNKEGILEIMTTPNQDSPLMEGATPILGNDVWEHAYYLNYQNRRADYLKAWWKLLHWEKIEKNFLSSDNL